MKAIDWVRAKAEMVVEDTDTVLPEFATEDMPAETPYTTRYYAFRGFVPLRMRAELKKQASELTDDETLDFGQYVSNGSRCTYTRSEIATL